MHNLPQKVYSLVLDEFTTYEFTTQGECLLSATLTMHGKENKLKEPFIIIDTTFKIGGSWMGVASYDDRVRELLERMHAGYNPNRISQTA